MFELLNLLFVTVSALVSTQLFLLHDAIAPPMGGVAKMEFTTARLAQVRTSHASETCVWSGVVVPYERTWPEVQSGFIEDKVLAPEPGKVAGYALVVNQQACPGQAPESMFRISEFKKPSRNGSFLYGRPTVSQLVSSIKPDERPKWLEQVMATVQAYNGKTPIKPDVTGKYNQVSVIAINYGMF